MSAKAIWGSKEFKQSHMANVPVVKCTISKDSWKIRGFGKEVVLLNLRIKADSEKLKELQRKKLQNYCKNKNDKWEKCANKDQIQLTVGPNTSLTGRIIC